MGIIKPLNQPAGSRAAADVGPPHARMWAPLPPLESALDQADLTAVRTLLRQGVDPTGVSLRRLEEATRTGDAAAECARLIEVAIRMERMHLARLPRPGGRPDAGAERSRAGVAGLGMRLASCFTGGAADGPIATAPVGTGSVGTRPGPVTAALRDHDLPAALKAMKKTRLMTAFSDRAREDRLIGMLATNDTQALLKLQQSGRLQRMLPRVKEPGVASALKQYGYRSTKPGRSVWRNNNGKVRFDGTDERIVCRHLVTYWMQDRKVGQDGKIDYAPLRDRTQLKGAFDHDYAKSFEYHISRCNDKHMVANDRFGTFFNAQFDRMTDPAARTQSQRMIILTITHAMACELKIKKAADGRPVYTVIFYDPNFTASHMRVRTHDRARIDSITLAELVRSKPHMNAYFKWPAGWKEDNRLTMYKNVSTAYVFPNGMARPTPVELRQAPPLPRFFYETEEIRYKLARVGHAWVVGQDEQ